MSKPSLRASAAISGVFRLSHATHPSHSRAFVEALFAKVSGSALYDAHATLKACLRVSGKFFRAGQANDKSRLPDGAAIRKRCTCTRC
jgi:hypothetical protein